MDKNLIQDIIRYNNSQNQVRAADFRSTDTVQKRLRDEAKKIKGVIYEGGRRGGFSSVIKRPTNLMPSFTVGQALAAFHGEPSIAYRKKSDIWNNDEFYFKFFNEKTTGPHLVFVYSLLKAIEQDKYNLMEKSSTMTDLTELEKQRYDFFHLPASIFIYANAIARTLETIIERRISDYFALSFGYQTSLEMAIKAWSGIISATTYFTSLLGRPILLHGLSKASIEEGIQNFIPQVAVAANSQSHIFSRFAKRLRNPSSSRVDGLLDSM
jgi:hypothetical protein